ncbi:MAG: gluconate transporter [Caulobacter sp. 12-67-6]|nr:MAG: gluconate transporter [Caulobacter sp. 12-67-6]OYX73468.1 MAG: gluconate transporter [Caulobacter sp. 32-67-35]
MDGPAMSLLIVVVSVATAVLLVLKARFPAFLALLIVALGAGLAFGGKPDDVIDSVRKGLGDALGFVAVVVGLGAMFGALLEAGGGVEAIANRLLARFGEKRALWALTAIGVVVGVPLFFDVALIILAPLLCALTLRSKRPIVWFALPTLAGLAVMHALLPPHPGPVAAAELLKADYGQIALWGFVCGLPAVLVAGPFYAWIAYRKQGQEGYVLPPSMDTGMPRQATIGFGVALTAMLAPLALIMIGALARGWPEGRLRDLVVFLGHPFTALILACVGVWLLLGLRYKTPRSTLLKITGRALEPAGAISLVVGAGAAFKQVLIDSGAGAHITAVITAAQVTPLMFAFLVAAIVRIAQGSATVAMVTAAGLAAPMVAAAGLPPAQVALVLIGIGAGATVVSHVNDTGFWLVSQYLGLTESQTFKAWTIGSTLAGLTTLAVAVIASAFL